MDQQMFSLKRQLLTSSVSLGWVTELRPFTFVHVFRETVEDPCCGRDVKELHWAAKDLVEQQVMKL